MIVYYLKKIYISLFSKSVIYNNKKYTKKNNLTIGLAIPLIGKHVKYLNNLLSIISQSEVLPDEVSVSVSSSFDDVSIGDYPFKVIITTTKYFQNAAQNRNTAARKLATNIISFFDADDLPHLKRFSFLIQAFNMGSLVVAHDYIQESQHNPDFFNSNIGSLKYCHKIINTKGVNCIFPVSKLFPLKYHCAHISIKREIFNKYKYDESKFYFRKEDAEYLARLVENKINICYINNKLSLYLK